MMLQLLLLAGVLFWLEGLHRTRALLVAIMLGVLGGALLISFASYLPRSIQRSLAVLPIDLDPAVKLDAQFSNEWRIRMWEEVLPEVPRYLILGKGYGFDPKEVDIARLNPRGAGTAEGSEVVGDYHNGPLSVIIPFGMFGTIGFFWFLWAAGRMFYSNYKYGDAALKNMNTFLFAYFIVKFCMFMAIFGSLYVDLPAFAGLAGLSISLNGGVAQRQAEAPEPAPLINRFRLSPGLRKPVGI
jgi:hypothetical protein